MIIVKKTPDKRIIFIYSTFCFKYCSMLPSYKSNVYLNKMWYLWYIYYLLNEILKLLLVIFVFNLDEKIKILRHQNEN